MLSVILPAYNEEKNIENTCHVIAGVLESKGIPFELIFVDDGSRDRTWEKIEQSGQNYSYVHGLSFSRNFGKEAAILSGLFYAKGDCCVVLDSDLQHPPETITEMYNLWEQGYEVVEGVKINRGKESLLHKFSAGLFYKLISAATKIDMSRASDFKLMDRKVVDNILAMPEKSIFFRAISSWVGFKKIQIDFEVKERQAGESKWSTVSLVKYAISNITSFSALPMQMITGLGILYLLFAMIMFFQTMYQYFLGKAIVGFSTVIILILLTGSLIMISLGIIGYYISKIYSETQNRPRYIVSKQI